jgi:C4-dicarboxylate-specific signal transduction histidine kinase/ActR/RegA family two-component response regulator/HAMP domain-containing protein
MIRAWMPQTITARLSAAVFALSFGVAAVGAWTSYRTASSALRERVQAQLDADASEETQRASEWLARQRALVELEAAELTTRLDSTLARTDSVPLRLTLASVLETEEVQLILVPGGRVAHSTDRAQVGRYAVDEEFYQFARDSTYTQKIYLSATSGRPRLTIAAPVRRAGSTVALLAAHLDLTRMEAAGGHQANARLPTDAYFVNRFAAFVSAQRFGREGVRRGVHSLAIDSALAGGRGAGLYTDYAGRAVLGAWRWIPELELALVVETPQEAALAPARLLLSQTLIIGLFATVLLALGVTTIARRFTSPVLKVADAASKVAAGNFGVRTPVESGDEVGRLASAFNIMTEQLETLYGRLESQVDATQRALVAAQTNRALLQDVVNNSSTLVLVVDLNDTVLLANDRVATVSGVPANAAPGQRLTDVLGASARTLSPLIERSRREHSVVEQEVMLDATSHAGGWQVVAFPLLRENGVPYATGLIGTDLTERARAEAERRARDASVQQVQKLESLGVMAGGIAHDFNNILGAIIGNTELARESLNRPDDVSVSLDRIAAASRRAAELTRQMLAYAGRASLRREVVDARDVIADIIPIVRASQSKKATLVADEMPEPLWVDLDPAQLSQVLLNLLTNAAEAIRDQPGTVRLHVGRGAPSTLHGGESCTHGWLQITVEDTGAGIVESVRARMFDPFFTTKASGRGLGLSAVRGIVKSLDGVLELTRTGPDGTRFDIYLRRAPSPDYDVLPLATTAANVVTGTVLIVDDEAPIREVAARVARRMGLQVVEAEDGARGVAQVRTHAHDVSVVLLDLTMPGMGGAEVLAELRSTHPQLPVIIVSGYDRDDALAEIGEDAATRFLAKPFDATTLRRYISDGLQERPIAR